MDSPLMTLAPVRHLLPQKQRRTMGLRHHEEQALLLAAHFKGQGDGEKPDLYRFYLSLQ
jgi:hypothetical protein